jgi:hypothetical protein
MEEWMKNWDVDQAVLDEMDEDEEEEEAEEEESSLFETEVDDPRVDTVQLAPDIPWRETPMSQIRYRHVWPGRGPALQVCVRERGPALQVSTQLQHVIPLNTACHSTTQVKHLIGE